MKKVIILSTKSRTDIVHSTSKYGGLFLSQYYSPMLEMGDNYQEIYIIDDQEEIKEGDWMFNSSFNSIVKAANNTLVNCKAIDGSYCAKIVATTDSSLNLPLINKKFIELYVEKQGKIEEVNMKIDYSELSDRTKAIVTPKEEVDDVEKLKPLGEINYEDTAGTWIEIVEVTKGRSIRPSEIGIAIELFELGKAWQKKRMYSKDEVIEIIYKSSYVLAHGDSTKQDADEWISQNLKK